MPVLYDNNNSIININKKYINTITTNDHSHCA